MLIHIFMCLIVNDIHVFSLLDVSAMTVDVMSSVFVSPSSGDYTNALAHYEKGITGNNKVSVCTFVKW